VRSHRTSYPAQNQINLGLAVLTITGILGAIVPLPTPAQLPLESDNTLGSEGSTIIPLQPGHAQIGGGAQRGNNLFHSFREFNVNNGGSVYFQNPADIHTIFSRVTGGNASHILGTLGVLGQADLFLLNPNGIIFGENARLDVASSFVASTANQFQFPDGSTFSAVNPTAPPLLTLSITPGLQYGANPPVGPLVNRGILYAPQNLTLSGHHLDLQGQLWAGGDLTLHGGDTLQIRDTVTAPFIAAAQGQVQVQGDRTVDIFALNHPDSGLWSGGDMVLRSPNPVIGDAHYYSGGNFRVEQLDGQVGALISPSDPIVLSTGDVTLGDYTGASLHILAGGRVSLGNVVIDGIGNADDTINPNHPNPFLARLATENVPNAVEGGVVDGASRFVLDVRAGIDWTRLGGFPLPTSPGIVPPGAVSITPGAATTADIDIASFATRGSILGGVVWLTNQYQPNGLAAPAGITLGTIDSGGEEGGGSITIESRSGITLDGNVISSAFNLGSSGNVTFQAVEDIRLQPGSSINSNSVNNDEANGFSQIRLESTNGSVFINQATIQAENDGTAFAGDILVDAGDRIEITNGSTLSASGREGRIRIGSNTIDPNLDPTVPNRVLLDSSQILATNDVSDTTLDQNAGDVVIRGESVSLVRSRPDLDIAFVATNTAGAGNGGNVDIFSQNLELLQGSEVLAQTFGAGDAGDITVLPLATNRPSSMTISGIAPFVGLRDDGSPNGGFSSGLISSTEEGATGNGGAITIGRPDARIGTLTIRNGGVISARTRSPGNGDDINVNVGQLILRNGGQILTSSLLFDPTGPATNTGSIAGNISVNASERVSIAGYNSTYNARFEELRQALLASGLDEVAAFQQTRTTIDPVSPNSGLQASDGFGFGQAGSITVTSPRIILADLANIDATTSGNRDAGNITIRTQNLSITGGASITSAAVGGFGSPNADGSGYAPSTGNAGAILVDALNPNRPSSIFLSGTAPVLLPDQDLAGNPIITPGGFSSGLVANSERFFLSDDIILTTQGNGGRIRVGTQSPFSQLTLNDGAVVATRTRSLGNAGNVRVRVNDLTITGGSQIVSATFGTGNAGDVFVNASGNVRIAGVDTGLGDRFTAVAQALIEEARAQGNTLSFEQAIDNATGLIDLVSSRSDRDGIPSTAPSGIQSRAEFGEEGPNSGNVTVQGGTLRLSDGAEINSERNNSATGNFSTVRLTARQGAIALDNSQVSSTNLGTGFAGDIFITSPSRVDISNGSQILSEGNLGRIFIGSDEGLSRPITPQSIRVRGRSQIRTDNSNAEGFVGAGTQTAGTISLRSRERIDVVGNGTQISSATFNQANAGSISFAAEDTVSIRNGAVVFSTIEAGAGADSPVEGGFIQVTTDAFELSNGAQLQSLVRGSEEGESLPGGRGNAGAILIEAQNQALFDNSAVFSSVQLGAEGNGGLIAVGDFRQDSTGNFTRITPTETIIFRNGAQLIADTTSTSATSEAGNVIVVGNGITFDGINDEGFPSAVFSGVGLGGAGTGGNVVIGGEFILDELDPRLNPADRVTISNGALISVSSYGFSQGRVTGLGRNDEQQQRAGNIALSARILDMDNGRRNLGGERGIFAETGLGGGGNIDLEIAELFVLRGATRVSTTAGRFVQAGDGGNITINATIGNGDGGYIIAEPFGNNDITADSVVRQGGAVNIDAALVYGLFFRSREDLIDELEPDDPLDPDRLRTSDVTAISQSDASLDGRTVVNAELTDLTQGLIELPTGLVDAANQIGQVCPTGPEAAQRLGRFVITGRGGISPSPLEALDLSDITTEWLEEGDRPSSPNPSPETPNPSQDSSTLREADHWTVSSNGQVQLVAQNPSHTTATNQPNACP